MAEGQLKKQWFYILVALAQGELHGAGIEREVRRLTEQRLRLWPAMLYTSLAELQEKRWIRELSAEEHPEGASHKRKYFQITDTGREVLSREVEAISRVISQARARLKPSVD